MFGPLKISIYFYIFPRCVNFILKNPIIILLTDMVQSVPRKGFGNFGTTVFVQWYV